MTTLENAPAAEPDLTPENVIRELSLYPGTLSDMFKSGALAGYKPGLRQWRIRCVDLDAFKQTRMNTEGGRP